MIKRGERISQELIDSVKDIDLVAYLESRGERFKREGNYYRHAEHDSLLICGNSFSWNSQNQHGYGAIRFNQVFYNMSFRESVQTLLVAKEITSVSVSPSKQEVRKAPFRYPIEEESEKTDAIRSYLIDERKIDARIVEWLIRKGLIAQDNRKNVVFKWVNSDGKVIGAERQGTVPTKTGKNTFKHIFPNEEVHAGFRFDIGKPEHILFFESPIDAMSYWTLHKELRNVRMQSMSGLKYNSVLYAVKMAKDKEGLGLKGIKVCVDNDDAGRRFMNYMKSITKSSFFDSHLPKRDGYDWNNVLQSRFSEKKHEKAASFSFQREHEIC